MILLHEILFPSTERRYCLLNTTTKDYTVTDESIHRIISQFIKNVVRNASWDDHFDFLTLHITNSYNVTSADFSTVKTAEASIYKKYPELLL